ncbi:MAG: LLM class flavin-dependent oxidoreductase [Holophagales bacterium]|nr:LLM class flavin-dependent oxidoreductase [Holophagales bacterium]MYD22397.1 LLM class flavin-dependent oxidoreductase [Holophagales bacterium]MYI33009.1 LLM class flavin-dependent oxidoreductase [Holophagales bacterium]
MKISLFYLPSIGSRADIKRGMAGLRGDLYDRMLAEVSEQARLADDLGYDSISFTEHHFHIEGFELSNNPVLLDLFVGMQTKNIRVGQLGIVLPARNPIRVAEDIAMLDRMTGGRANAGFARGYQRRWVDVMAQQTHGISGALPHRHDEIDATNRAAFEECFRIVKKAWTEPMLDYDGRFWKVPVGGSKGGTPWTLDATEQWGAGVEDGVLRQVGVVPKPVQEPHPPIFQPFASSEASIRWCAREGVTAILPPLHPKRERALFELFAEESGRPLGEGIGVLRDVVIAESDTEAERLWKASGAFCGSAWFEPFGFSRGMIDPDTGEEFDDMMGSGMALVGTVDTVTRQLQTLRERLPVTWLYFWAYNGLLPHARLMSTIERFKTEVLPRVGAS